LDWHSRPTKNRGSAENVAIFDDYVHDLIVSRGANHSAPAEAKAHRPEWLSSVDTALLRRQLL
jgi:hypothetical protein